MTTRDDVVYQCGEFLLESANRRFSRNGVEVPLEPKAFAVLLQLLARAGELVTREQLLDAVWGHRFVTPSTLNRVLALVRRAFGDDVEQPRYVQTVHGTGYRYIGPIQRLQADAMAPFHARFVPPPAVRVPAPLETLIGRDHEIAQLAALLASSRAVTVVGTGGMGKTQCALAFARQRAADHADGVWFFDLAPLERAEQWLELLAQTLGIRPASERDLMDRISQTLSRRHALLLLDNCDRIAASVGRIVFDLLRATEHVKVMATSQVPLGFVGERLLRLPPLALPPVEHVAAESDLDEVASAPAVALLLARIHDVQPAFSLQVDNAATIVAICERLDGMPLALELAAARFALLSPPQVLERLSQRFRFLTSAATGRDARHRSLSALLDWSIGLLSSDERQLLAWLAVFVQGWTVDAMLALAAPLQRDPETMVELLGGLAQKSLVAVDQASSPPRYRLLESVREFALAQLAASGEERRARDAQLQWVRHTAQEAHRDLVGGRMRERIALLLDEHGNIESASAWALGAGDDPEAALEIAGSLALYFKAHGNMIFGLRLTERALKTAPATRSRARSQALMSHGVNGLMLQSARPDVALLEAMSVAREVGDEWTEAYASGYYALWLANVGRAAEAMPHAAVTAQIAERLDDGILQGLAGLARGWMHLAQEQLEQAVAALRAVRLLGDDMHQHHFIDVYIALALFRSGDLRAAAACWREAMVNGLAVGNIRGLAGSIEGCAYIAERLGERPLACRYLGAAEQIRRRTGTPLYNFWIGHNGAALERLRSALGTEARDAALQSGMQLREEDAVNEVAQSLQAFATIAR